MRGAARWAALSRSRVSDERIAAPSPVSGDSVLSKGQAMRAPITATTAQRKLAAKRHNERLKLFATTANTIGLGILATATIIPNFGQTPPTPGIPPVPHPWWTGPAAFLVLFSVALAAYRFLRSED